MLHRQQRVWGCGPSVLKKSEGLNLGPLPLDAASSPEFPIAPPTQDGGAASDQRAAGRGLPATGQVPQGPHAREPPAGAGATPPEAGATAAHITSRGLPAQHGVPPAQHGVQAQQAKHAQEVQQGPTSAQRPASTPPPEPQAQQESAALRQVALQRQRLQQAGLLPAAGAAPRAPFAPPPPPPLHGEAFSAAREAQLLQALQQPPALRTAAKRGLGQASEAEEAGRKQRRRGEAGAGAQASASATFLRRARHAPDFYGRGQAAHACACMSECLWCMEGHA